MVPNNEGFSGGKPHPKEDSKVKMNGGKKVNKVQAMRHRMEISSREDFAGGGAERTPAGDYSVNTTTVAREPLPDRAA
jgi:hypothetical protein